MNVCRDQRVPILKRGISLYMDNNNVVVTFFSKSLLLGPLQVQPENLRTMPLPFSNVVLQAMHDGSKLVALRRSDLGNTPEQIQRSIDLARALGVELTVLENGVDTPGEKDL